MTNELVAWLNAVDESYRSEFRELFAANFGQVRAEMSQLRAEVRGELAELRSELRGEMAELRSELRGEMADLRSEVRGELSLVRGELSQLRTEVRHDIRSRVAEAEKRLVGWTFKLWLGQVAVTIGVILAARAIWH